MPLSVSDASANRNDKIANAAKVIGKSKDRLKVFLAIYTGKTKIKTVSDIINATDLKNRVRVLQEGKKLSSEDIIIPTKVQGETAYEKIDFYTHNRSRIVSLVKNKKKLNKFPTKINPQSQPRGNITVKFSPNLVNIKQVTIDDIHSFSKVRKHDGSVSTRFYESEVKNALKNAIGESGEFTDWGGETDDLYSTRLMLNGQRISVAFGLKGRGTSGILTPKKMGKNGDQIQRLFKSPAEVFFVQYVGQIDESVLDQMKSYAIAKSATEAKRIYYGVIDGKDTVRLISAYAKDTANRGD